MRRVRGDISSCSSVDTQHSAGSARLARLPFHSLSLSLSLCLYSSSCPYNNNSIFQKERKTKRKTSQSHQVIEIEYLNPINQTPVFHFILLLLIISNSFKKKRLSLCLLILI